MRVPLVRVEGKAYVRRADLQMTAERFAEGAELDREARDQIARDAEVRYGLGECLYFYAGYACPDFGNIVLVYEPELADNHKGNASSFDTGGMFKGYIKGDHLSDELARDRLVASDLADLHEWQHRLMGWVQNYFRDVEHYLEENAHSRPLKDDGTGRLTHKGNDRRAWTYEVRLHENVPLFDHLAFLVVRQDFWIEALARATDFDRSRLLSFKETSMAFILDAADDTKDTVHKIARRQIIQYVTDEEGA